MTAFARIPTDSEDPLPAVRTFLAKLLEDGQVMGVVVPVETGDGRSVHPALITDPARMARANPLMPVLPISGARMAALFARGDANGAGPTRIAVVMHPCEVRALVELAKLRQVNMAQLLTIGIDCVGTFEGEVLRDAEDPETLTRAVVGAARAGEAGPPGDAAYRPACEICETPAPWRADIRLHLIGVPHEDGILVEIDDEDLLPDLGFEDGADPRGHRDAVEALMARRGPLRTERLDAYRAEMGSDGAPGIYSAVETCQRCFNCTVACPICYCVECLFRTNVFAHEPERYLGWAGHRGATRLPGDTLTFQLTRLTHVTASCVGCGLCTSACPAGLPLDTLFQTVARDMQVLFDYVPGRDPDEPLPTAVFKQDEFVDLGERKH